MNRKKGLIYAGLAATFTVFALARFPVALAADWLIPQKINLAGSEGSLWQGRASALGLDGMAVQQDIAWKFRPGDLARGQLAWDVSGKFAGDSSKLVLSVSPVSVELRDVQLALPLEPLLNLDAKLKSLRLGGMVKLRSASFSPLRPSQASVLLENVFSALAGWVILGQKLTARELLGCALVFIAIISSQLPWRKWFGKQAVAQEALPETVVQTDA